MEILINDVFQVEALPDHETVCLKMKNAKDGTSVELTIPMVMLSEAASFAQKMQTSKYQREVHGADEMKGSWIHTPMCALGKWGVAEVPMFSPPEVLLVCDIGASYQLSYRMSTQAAADVARSLLATSEKLQGQKSQRH
jgi:hypothetical protein